MEDLKEKIKRIRISKKINQDQVAECAGLSRVAYSFFESGRIKKLSLDSAIGIAKALDVPFNELFDIPDKTDTLKNRIKELEDELAACNDRYSKIYEELQRERHINGQGLNFRNFTMHIIEIFEILDFEIFEKYHPKLLPNLERINTYSVNSVFRFMGEKKFTSFDIKQAEDYLWPFVDVEKYSKSQLLYMQLLSSKTPGTVNKESLIQLVIDAKKRLE